MKQYYQFGVILNKEWTEVYLYISKFRTVEDLQRKFHKIRARDERVFLCCYEVNDPGMNPEA